MLQLGNQSKPILYLIGLMITNLVFLSIGEFILFPLMHR